MRRISKAERTTIIAISAVDGIGCQTMWRLWVDLWEKHISWQNFWRASETTWMQFGLKEPQRVALKEFQKKYSPAAYQEMLESKKIQVVLAMEPAYPFLLRHAGSKPFLFFYKGPNNFWDTLPIAVVGTRHMTGYGEQVTKKITRELVSAGATIVSGFMYGVDAVAHRTAMEHNGKSVAVLGFGFDHIFPATHHRLLTEFLEKGNTAITEFAPAVPAQRGNFPARNRIVAGMSRGVVVTEAGEKSGSLITAQFAVDYNRAVCAVPGPISHINYEGTRALVNEGARLVASGQEILEEIGIMAEKTPELTHKFSNPLDQKIYAALKAQALTTDDLCEMLHQPVEKIAVRMSMLELQNAVERKGIFWQVLL